MKPQFKTDSRSDFERKKWVFEYERLGTRRAILGTNEWAESVAKQLDIEYFIDDYSSEESFCGKPVIRGHKADRTVMTLTTSIGRPLSARESVIRYADSHLDYYSFLKHTTLSVKGIQFIADQIYEDADTIRSLVKIREMLADEASVETLDRIVSLRRELNLEAMIVFADRQKEQYFEPFLDIQAGHTFIDVGAFDGYTSDTLIRRFGPGIRCHLFEPGQKMIDHLRVKYRNSPNIVIHPLGLSNQKGQVAFSERGSASTMGAGPSVIEVNTLDSFNFQEVDFIKVDIEGAEELFLEGARKTIRRCQPQLAIACYHSNRQLPAIFHQALSLMPDARIYLRHYTEGFAETDFFFVPKRFW